MGLKWPRDISTTTLRRLQGTRVNTEIVLVMTTSDCHEKLKALAERLVEQRMAACVQIEGPITSLYRWDAKLEISTEWRLTAKTTPELAPRVETLINNLHHYELPEILVLSAKASEEYGKWVGSQVVAEPQQH